VRVVSSPFGNYQSANDDEHTEKPSNCPYTCDPDKALGSPQLSSRYISLVTTWAIG
jgi:hypothetical protein